MAKKESKREGDVLNSTINDLSKRHNAPLYMYFVLIFLYFLATLLVSNVSGTTANLYFGSLVIPAYTFAGVFSALANICVILLPVFYGKLGFNTSLVFLILQTPLILLSVIKRGNVTSIPGIFSNLLAVIAVLVVYVKNRSMRKYQDTLQYQAITDLKTGLPNSFACSELLHDLIKRNIPFVLVSIDLNGFKHINDTMGFSFGDKVLCEVASRWKDLADSGLSHTHDFITRISGDEFALVIRDYKTDEDIINSIRQYEVFLRNRLTIDEYDFFINASFGYAKFPEDADNSDSLLSYAAAAMKEIKRVNTGEHILHYTPSILNNEKTLLIEGKIRTALDKDLIFCQLQPQYSMDHKLRGFEALARMKDSDGSIVSPGEFIPVAEEVGLIDAIDSSVFRIAAGFLGDLVKKTGTTVTVSVNVSARHMMKNGFVEEVKDIIKTSGVPASQIEIELTESIMIESVEKALSIIEELKAIGVMIAIDDFGTGYSSLSYLNRFPANLLKIDKSFIDRMNLNDSSKQYVAAIISIGHILGFEVISEGVEDNTQLETLREINCDFIQGFVWGKPLPLEEAEKLVLA